MDAAELLMDYIRFSRFAGWGARPGEALAEERDRPAADRSFDCTQTVSRGREKRTKPH